MKEVKFEVDLNDFLFLGDSQLGEDITNFIEEEITEHCKVNKIDLESVPDYDYSTKTTCKVEVTLKLMEVCCQDCSKLGENTCGNDTEKFSCFE